MSNQLTTTALRRERPSLGTCAWSYSLVSNEFASCSRHVLNNLCYQGFDCSRHHGGNVLRVDINLNITEDHFPDVGIHVQPPSTPLFEFRAST